MERIAKWGAYDPPFVRRRYNRLAKFFVLFEWFSSSRAAYEGRPSAGWS